MANFRLLEKFKLSIFVKILIKIITKMFLPASEGGKKRDKINLISSIGGRKVGEGHSKKRKKEKKAYQK